MFCVVDAVGGAGVRGAEGAGAVDVVVFVEAEAEDEGGEGEDAGGLVICGWGFVGGGLGGNVRWSCRGGRRSSGRSEAVR